MLRLLAAATCLVALTACLDLELPPAPPQAYASYEHHLAYDPQTDELRWIEVMHGIPCTDPSGSVQFLESWTRKRPVYPADSLFCLDLEGCTPLDGVPDDERDAWIRTLGELAQRLEVTDAGVFEEGDCLGAWRRSRVRGASEMLSALNAMLREGWELFPERPRSLTQDALERASPVRCAQSQPVVLKLPEGWEALHFEGDRLFLDVPMRTLEELVAASGQQPPEDLGQPDWPFTTQEIVERADGERVLRASTPGGWSSVTGQAWQGRWFHEMAGTAPPLRPDPAGVRKTLREAGVELGPAPDVAALETFAPASSAP